MGGGARGRGRDGVRRGGGFWVPRGEGEGGAMGRSGLGLSVMGEGVLGQMSYLVAKNGHLDSSRTMCVGDLSHKGQFSEFYHWVASISPEGFLLPILLLVVIIVTVVIVIVILIVVVDDVSLILKLLFTVERMKSTRQRHHRLIVTGVPVGLVFLLGLLALAIDAVCAFRAEEMPLLISCWMAAKVMAGVSDVDVLLGGILSTQDNAYSSGIKKYRGSNSSDGGNIRDEVKIDGQVIGSGDEIGPSLIELLNNPRIRREAKDCSHKWFEKGRDVGASCNEDGMPLIIGKSHPWNPGTHMIYSWTVEGHSR
ncbi:hypothetical protein Tco_0608041 [Tanacetum coccineum]